MLDGASPANTYILSSLGWIAPEHHPAYPTLQLPMQGMLKGDPCWTGLELAVWQLTIYLQNILIQKSQAGGQQYSNIPFSIPWNILAK